MGMIDLFHTYVKPDDMMDKAGLIKMLQDNFPTFLSACVSRGGCPPCAGPGVAEDALLVPWTGHSPSPVLTSHSGQRASGTSYPGLSSGCGT